MAPSNVMKLLPESTVLNICRLGRVKGHFLLMFCKEPFVVLQALGSSGLSGVDEWEGLWTTRVILFTERLMVGERSLHKAELRGRDLNLSGSRSPVE